MPKALRKSKRGTARAGARSPKADEHSWQVQTAKARFSEVFRLARTQGPQRITRQGKEGVVMISNEQYDRLTARPRRPKSIVQFFRESPLVGVDLDWERDKDTGRDIDL
ncbi:MAG: type II toxin-antitoxin system prevent-host-death family antitoxin [Bryobacteraceae bacterium]|jgi:prevent-host-death family protein